MEKKIHIKTGIILLLLVVSFTAVSCGGSSEESVTPDQPVTVELGTATMQPMEAMQKYAGTVASEHTVNLSTKVMGRISELNVEEGDYARKGDVLVQIKDNQIRAQKKQVEANLDQAKANLENVEKNYNRLKALYESESVTQKEFDDMRTQYRSTQAQVQALESKLSEINDMLDYTTLEAPFDGYIVSRNASEGDMASPGRPILGIEKAEGIEVLISVPETEISRFTMQDTVTATVSAAGRQEFKGVVSNINPSATRGSRQFQVEITLIDYSKQSGLKSGMFAEVGVRSVSDSVITVPASAIINRGQLTGLYTLSGDSELMLRWVRLGEQKNNRVQILSGLSAGEQYVTAVDGSLREGLKVSAK